MRTRFLEDLDDARRAPALLKARTVYRPNISLSLLGPGPQTPKWGARGGPQPGSCALRETFFFKKTTTAP